LCANAISRIDIFQPFTLFAFACDEKTLEKGEVCQCSKIFRLKFQNFKISNQINQIFEKKKSIFQKSTSLMMSRRANERCAFFNFTSCQELERMYTNHPNQNHPYLEFVDFHCKDYALRESQIRNSSLSDEGPLVASHSEVSILVAMSDLDRCRWQQQVVRQCGVQMQLTTFQMASWDCGGGVRDRQVPARLQ
jgi:hypothetical protein